MDHYIDDHIEACREWLQDMLDDKRGRDLDRQAACALCRDSKRIDRPRCRSRMVN